MCSTIVGLSFAQAELNFTEGAWVWKYRDGHLQLNHSAHHPHSALAHVGHSRALTPDKCCHITYVDVIVPQ